jgi:death-on-curing protein
MSSPREVRYPASADIIAINRKATKESGDPFVILHAGTLDYLLSAVRYKYNDKPFEEAVLLKAAHLLDLLANKGHVFIEGNKRTAISVTVSFLKENGLGLDTADQKALADFVLAVAQGNKTLGDSYRWLKERVKTHQVEPTSGDTRG